MGEGCRGEVVGQVAKSSLSVRELIALDGVADRFTVDVCKKA
jgi:hypothetical protein